jgi:hypothetical protein
MDKGALLRKGKHPAFSPPDNIDVKLWRYMDLTQFMSMLEEQGVLFTRADLFDDKFEGTMSKPLHDFLKERSWDPQQHADLLRMTKAWSFVSCWHMNEVESAAMWKIYSASKESICIQTTFARLRDVLPEDVYIGTVSYILYDRDKIPAGNVFWPLTYKRLSFEHERELRAVWSNMAGVSSAEPAVAAGLEYRPAPQESVWKHVDLSELIENLFVSPTAKPWFRDLLEKLLHTYGLLIPIQQSDLAANPLF